MPAGEHIRWAGYRKALADVPQAEETALVASVLTDPDQVIAEAAVSEHIERRATALLRCQGFAEWAARVAPVVDGHPFLTQRLQEWALLRAITRTEPWSPAALLTASDYLQRLVTTHTDCPEALTLLAESGKTRRIRTTAKAKIS
ncbi:hypothetical protein [Actinocrispum sp. NPDC049592]|uniref:hypothetical protein n=1 Tax=Actinocrispum sp. NPDC049592 TaxID=3154835 RepID=UPI003423B936